MMALLQVTAETKITHGNFPLTAFDGQLAVQLPPAELVDRIGRQCDDYPGLGLLPCAR